MQKGNAQIVVPPIWITRLSLDKMQECSRRRHLRQNPSKNLHGILQSCWNLLQLLIQPDSFNWGWGRDQQRIVYEEGAKERERERSGPNKRNCKKKYFCVETQNVGKKNKKKKRRLEDPDLGYGLCLVDQTLHEHCWRPRRRSKPAKQPIPSFFFFFFFLFFFFCSKLTRSDLNGEEEEEEQQQQCCYETIVAIAV